MIRLVSAGPVKASISIATLEQKAGNVAGRFSRRGAELVVEEVRASIGISDLPAAPGEPPHSSGPYAESWHAGKTWIRRASSTATS